MNSVFICGCKWRRGECTARVQSYLGLFLGSNFSAEVCHHPLMECYPRIWFKSQMARCACLCVCEMGLQCMFPLPSQKNDQTPLFGNKASQDFFMELLSLRSCPPPSKSLKVIHFQVCQSVDFIISHHYFLTIFCLYLCYVALASQSGTCYITQVSLQLIATLLPQSSECWYLGMNHHTQLSTGWNLVWDKHFWQVHNLKIY